MIDLCKLTKRMEDGIWPRVPNEDGVERELITNMPIILRPDARRKRFTAFPGRHIREIIRDLPTELRDFALV
jgi:hypothetical protein